MNKNNVDLLNTKSYYYDLPEDYIAQTPAEPRDSSRLLVYHKDNNTIEHKVFRDIIDYFKSGDVLVLNNKAILLIKLKRYNEALSILNEVLNIDENNITAIENKEKIINKIK